MQDDLLRRLSDRQHPQFEFVKLLAVKCSFLLFGKEHVKSAFKEIQVLKASGSTARVKASFSLLVVGLKLLVVSQ